MTPTGLVRMGRRNLRVVAAVYLLVAGIALGAPVLMSRSGETPHPITETNRR
jgi:hypothetical protein